MGRHGAGPTWGQGRGSGEGGADLNGAARHQTGLGGGAGTGRGVEERGGMALC